MILDKQLIFDWEDALTATRNSTNVIDLLRAGQDIGTGENMFVYFTVTTVLDSAGEAATLQIALVTDDNAALTSPVTLQDQPALIAEATLVAGYELMFRVHPSSVMERYLGLVYTVGTENFTSGKVTAGLVKDVERWKAYAKNFVTA